MRFVISLILTVALVGAVPTGYIGIRTDSVPAEVHLDDRLLIVGPDGCVAEAGPGKHFVSLFPPRKVFLAFKDDSPEHFWNQLRRRRAVGEATELLSSYERGAIQVGTKWVYVVPGDTQFVRLSYARTQETYQRDSSCLLGTFLGWTLLIATGMVLSVVFSRLD